MHNHAQPRTTTDIESGGLFTTADALAFLAVSRSTLAGLVRTGELPVVRIGRSVRFRRADLERFVSRNLCFDPAETVAA